MYYSISRIIKRKTLMVQLTWFTIKYSILNKNIYMYT